VSTLVAACAAAVIALVVVGIYDTVRFDRSARRASRNSQKAIEAVNRLLTQVSRDELADRPEMEEVRRQLFEDALEILKELRADGNESDPLVRRALGHVHESIALLRANLGDRTGSMRDYQETIAIQAKLVEEYPTDGEYPNELAISHEGLAFLHIDDPTLAESRPHFEIAIKLLEPLAAGDLVSLGRLAQCYNNFSLAVGHIEGDTAEVKESREKAMAIRENLNDHKDPDRYLPDLVQSRFNIALHRQSKEGAMAEVVESLREVLASCEKLTDTTDPRRKRRNLNALAGCQTALALVLKDEKASAQEAEDLMETAIKSRKMLVRDYPGSVSFQDALASVLHCRGIQKHKIERNAEARDLFRQTIEIRECMIERSPDNLHLRALLAEDYGVLALASHRMDESPVEVTRLYAQAREILEPLCRAYPDAPSLARMLAQVSIHYAGFSEGQENDDGVIEILDRAVTMLEKFDRAVRCDWEMSSLLTEAYKAVHCSRIT
jgi:tetratricopeptide (TPR) repeat protein